MCISWARSARSCDLYFEAQDGPAPRDGRAAQGDDGTARSNAESPRSQIGGDWVRNALRRDRIEISSAESFATPEEIDFSTAAPRRASESSPQ